jgi:hypothetical protein
MEVCLGPSLHAWESLLIGVSERGPAFVTRAAQSHDHPSSPIQTDFQVQAFQRAIDIAFLYIVQLALGLVEVSVRTVDQDSQTLQLLPQEPLLLISLSVHRLGKAAGAAPL